MGKFENFIRKNRNAVLSISTAALFFNFASFAVPEEVAVEVPKEAWEESINRIELEGWEPDVGVIRKDGSINFLALREEASWCAKVLYGTARNNTEKQQETVIWCIVNRMENQWYPDTIREVCKQNYQFMGFQDNNPVEDGLFKVAYKVLYNYYVEGYKPVANVYVYMSATDSDIMLRNNYESNTWTAYWQVT